MHDGTVALLQGFVRQHLQSRRGHPTMILHVGDEGVDEIRPVFDDPTWTFTNAGQLRGRSQVTLQHSYAWPELKSDAYDVVTSSQAFEHFDFPWVAALELARVLRPGGLACLIASSDPRDHLPAVDGWHFHSDGLMALVEWADLENLQLSFEARPDTERGPVPSDTCIIARKPIVSGSRKVFASTKLGALRSLAIRQAQRRANHLEIRRDLRRREARRRAWSSHDEL